MDCLECRQRITDDLVVLTYSKAGKGYPLKKCKKCVNQRISKLQMARRKIPGGFAWYRRRYDRIKYSAKKRGYSFSLSFNDWKQLYLEEICYYCETPAEVTSIDRVDNTLGYTPSNCVMSCMSCNKLKSHMTLEQIRIFYEKAVLR